MIDCLLPAAWRRRRVSSVRVHRRHPQQLGPRNPARLTAARADDQAHRGAGGRFRIARRTADARHPRRYPGRAGAGAGLGGAPGYTDLADGRRDVGAQVRRRRRGRSPASPRGCWQPATPPMRRPTAIPRSSKASRSPVPHSWVGATGYLETVSWRTQRDRRASQANVVWLSPLVPLVDSEPTTELQRLAMVVDSRQRRRRGTGPRAVRVHEHRHRRAPAPAARRRTTSRCGPAARSAPTAIGVTTAEIFDRQGFIGDLRADAAGAAAGAGITVGPRLYICLHLYRCHAILASWTSSKPSPNRAGGRCSTRSSTVNAPRANSSRPCPG